MAHEHFPITVPQLGPDDREEDFDAEENGGFPFAANASSAIRRRLHAGGAPFRITIDYTYLENNKYQCHQGVDAVTDLEGAENKECNENEVVTDEKKEYIKRLTEAAKDWFVTTLRVLHPSRGALKLRKYCYQFPPPPDKDPETKLNRNCYSARDDRCRFNSPETDFYLTVTANPTDGDTLAYALTCQSDSLLGRPIAGLVNYGPAHLTAKPENWHSELSTAIHEISHALGFSSTKFADFIDASGVRRGKDNVVRQFRDRGHTITKIVTPKVVEEMKRHFACYDWPDAGGELEDFGGEGTAGSHWEKRIFRDEFMTGIDSQHPVISSISLALFEDTGWYKANYASAEHLHWGYQEGCTFAMDHCDKWGERFFCPRGDMEACTHDRLFKGVCNVGLFEQDLPQYHQYFPGEPRKGGRDAHADYCPYYQGYTNQDCRVKEFMGVDALTVGERYGPSSRCFDTTVLKKRYKLQNHRPYQRCHQTYCLDGDLIVRIGPFNVSCPRGGGKIPVDDLNAEYKGFLWCPPASEICATGPVDQGNEDVIAPPVPKADEAPEIMPMELIFGQPATALAAQGEPYYIVIDNSKTTTGVLKIVVDGIYGSVYIRADKACPPRKEAGLEPNFDDGGDDKETGDRQLGDGIPRSAFPTEENNEYSAEMKKVRVGVQSSTVKIPTSLQERGARLLLTLVPKKPQSGIIRLKADCAHPCLNRGRCVDGACECEAGFAGLRCGDRLCPLNCSSQGTCDASDGTCSCNAGWKGLDCSEKDIRQTQFTFDRGTVAPSSWAYFHVTCPNPLDPLNKCCKDGGRSDKTGAACLGQAVTLEYKMVKLHGAQADPYLFAQTGKEKPTSSQYTVRDRVSWRMSLKEHQVNVKTRTGMCGGATIGIWNTEYSQEDAVYSGSVKCISQEASSVSSCPSTAAGDCNAKGVCTLDLVKRVRKCDCNVGWTGAACDERRVSIPSNADLGSLIVPEAVRGLQLLQGESNYVSLAVPPAFMDLQLTLQIRGLSAWMGISVNKGRNVRPQATDPKKASYHNYGANRWEWDTQRVSKVVIPRVDRLIYTILINNIRLEKATFDLSMVVGSKPSFLLSSEDDFDDEGRSRNDESMEEQEDPAVPLTAAVDGDGRLPDPLLTVSSRSGIEGIASSTEMRLIKVQEFCKLSKFGFREECSSIAGTVTICTDRPHLVFHGLKQAVQPKDAVDFLRRSYSSNGPPLKRWSHLPSWEEACSFHSTVKVNNENAFVGVAARRPGEHVTFMAVMAGVSGIFLSDTGDFRKSFVASTTALMAICSTALVMSTCLFGFWYRKRRARQLATQFATSLRRSTLERSPGSQTTRRSVPYLGGIEQQLSLRNQGTGAQQGPSQIEPEPAIVQASRSSNPNARMARTSTGVRPPAHWPQDCC